MKYTLTTAKDGTKKLTFQQGYQAVLIPKKEKYTLCVSSQIGCVMNCQFCHTAKLGFKRNLTTAEIVEQLEFALKELSLSYVITKNNPHGKEHAHDVITSIVFMGQGEPLANYTAVIEACEEWNLFYGYPFKKMCISTSGMIPQMKKVIACKHPIQLAVSLHSPFQSIRNTLMPTLQSFPIEKLVPVMHEYNKYYKQKIMIEYLMIEGLTDRDEDLNELCSLGFDKQTNINLIPLNTSMVVNGKEYGSSSKERIVAWKEALMKHGFKCFVREHMGEDIDAACGMLSGK